MRIDDLDMVEIITDVLRCDNLILYVDFVEEIGHIRFKFQAATDTKNWNEDELNRNIDNGLANLAFEVEADTPRKVTGVSILLGAPTNAAPSGKGIAQADVVLNILDKLESISMLGTEKVFVDIVYNVNGYEDIYPEPELETQDCDTI